VKTCLATSPTHTKFGPLVFSGDLGLAMQQATRLGYQGLELNLRDSRALDQDHLLAELSRLGLAAPSIGTGQAYFADGLSLADADPAIQHAVVERLQGHVELAARLGARVVLGSIRGRLSENSREGYLTAIRLSRELAGFAAGKGVSLLVEPINRYETDFLNTVAEAIEFIDQVGADNLGILGDTFHMNIEEASMVNAFRLAGDRLWHVHLADSNRRAPGMGHLDFGPLLAELSQIGFAGYLSAEILPLPDDATAAESWIDATRQALRAFGPGWAK
jgi:5-keto-L-gluconate epimerase